MKEVSTPVVVVVIAIVVVIVAVFGWRAVSAPGPTDLKPITKEMKQKHAESAAEIRQEQMKLLHLGQASTR